MSRIAIFAYGVSCIVLIIGFFSMISPVKAHLVTANKTYHFPTHHGYRLSWCTYDSNRCGRHAAYTFCKSRGHNDASTYSIHHNAPPVRQIGDRKVCSDHYCDGFKHITCVGNNKKVSVTSRHRAYATFHQPRFKGYPLGACHTWKRGCGQHAAQRYCHHKGYRYADNWHVHSSHPPTRLLGSQQVCPYGHCARFKWIRCGR